MSRLLHALSARDSHIWTLRIALVFLFVLRLALSLVLHLTQRRITVHVPPDLSRGSVLRAGEVPLPNVYAFALTVFQALNFWPRDGSTEYPALAEKYNCYCTPNFRRWLASNVQTKKRRGELQRSRGLFPLGGYSTGSVRRVAADTWEVRLDLGLREWVQNRVVKDVALRYVLRVTGFDVSAECNPWGLALDGHAQAPRRVEAD